ncbi:MAG: LytTR family DNA-binding domain-containing protein [Pseudomonadota bacterium]
MGPQNTPFVVVCHFTKREWAGIYHGMASETPKPMSSRATFWRSTLTDLAIMTVIGVFLAVLGPFGSIDQPFAVRLVTWLAFSYLGYSIYSPMGYFVDRAHASLDLPLLPLWIVAAAIATVPMTAAIYFIQFVPDMPPMPSLEEALTSFFYVFVIGGGITLLFNFIGPRANASRAKSVESVAPAPPHIDTPAPAPAPMAQPPSNPLVDQLPAELGSDIIALEMEDHYVRVHTALGSELVLMRLRDAMVHLSEVDGRQIHRSWWVARGAVEDVVREGRNVRLKLPRDIEAPVSRAQVGELRDAGWL